MVAIRSLVGAVLGAALFAGAAFAADFPSQKISILLPTPPGGSIDLLGRALADKLKDRVGQPVIIENRPGAGGMIAAEAVARSAPDGYTLAMVGGSISTGPIFLKANKVDPEKDFTPIRRIAYSSFVAVVPPSLGVKTMKEFIDHAKKNPKKLNYGVIPVSGMQLDMMQLMKVAGVDVVEVPFPGIAAILQAELGGQIEFGLMAHSTIRSHVATGALVPLATTGAKRMASLPELPTIREATGLDFDMGFWYGFVAPAGTPKDVIEKLDREIAAAAKHPDFVKLLSDNGFEEVQSSPAELGAVIAKEYRLYQDVAKKAGIEPK